MVGIAIRAKVRPPAKILNPICKYTTKKANPNNPNTIEGTEANVSVANLIVFTKVFSPEYSAR